jgi:transposase
MGLRLFLASLRMRFACLPNSTIGRSTVARPASVFVNDLSDDDRNWLVETWKTHRMHSTRARALSVLLSSQGRTILEIATLLMVDEDTARCWINRWFNGKRENLEDEHRVGCPTTLNADEQAATIEMIKEHPSEPKVVINLINEQFGKTISRDTLRRIAKKAGMRWKRFRKSIKNLRDPMAFQAARDEIAKLTGNPKINVAFFDESTFSLTGVVPYGWQPAGERAEIELSGKRNSIHVLAIENASGITTSYLHQGSINGSTVVEVIDDFASHIRKPTVLVLDNASPHTCKEVLAHKQKWEDLGLVLYPLPPYSPELNAIEHLWKSVKYTQLPAVAWKSVELLLQNLTSVFSRLGRTVLMPSLQNG